MDDRTQPNRDSALNQRAPSAPSSNDAGLNGRQSADFAGERSSSSSKPALTERERSERWPVG
jgi:hypothetical protein